MIDKKTGIALALLVSACLASFVTAQDAPTTSPTTAPAAPSIIDVSDQAALDANKGNDVTIKGVVQMAAWSSSGKVMNITFEGADQTKLTAVVFSKSRERIDTAFGGDAANAWTGAKVRIRGNLREYGGKAEGRKGNPEMTISDPAQVTVVEPAPATQPSKAADTAAE